MIYQSSSFVSFHPKIISKETVKPSLFHIFGQLIKHDMTENLHTAIQLSIVGMVSVFFILGIVVGLGKLLILSVNKYSPTPVAKSPRSFVSNDTQEIAVLTSVVDIITQGKGRIKSIKKI